MALSGCSETLYELFPDTTGGASNSGGQCGATDCAGSGGGGPSGGASAASGGEAATTSDTSNEGGSDTGDTGSPAEPGDPCASKIVAGKQVEMLRFVGSGNCIAQGASTLLAGYPGFLVETQSCSQDPEDGWIVIPMGNGAESFRSESTNMNLDVQFAAPTAGTPLVLYEPLANYNQRFTRVLENDTGFLLSPLHATNMCLTESNGAVQIRQCSSTAVSQRLTLLECQSLAP